MALEITYDADGCEGVLERSEELPAPESSGILVWGAITAVVALVVGPVTAAVVASTWPSKGLVVVLTLGLTYLIVKRVEATGWDPVLRRSRERFRVRQGVLTVWSDEGEQSAPLAGAKVRIFHDGVWVNPALGKPIRLAWDGATKNDVAALAEALERAAQGTMQSRGTRHEVPSALTKLTE